MANLQKWNNIKDPNKIIVGQVLKLTGSSSPSKLCIQRQEIRLPSGIC
ncbi:LysM peptidoglycan-binding domain-containing protein [Bacillus stercoris]|nr:MULTISPECIES: LysM peptidoglycan-binding domain-containing protein [Bacillus]MCM2583061.1 LysM peptidoglycan-binding domain-containing protein [Bacillus stercoris]WGE40561.1 LysM peptidoglycan-binding domain-containing protein [Bacillus stercoris]